MASKDGRPSTDLKKDFFKRPKAYSFFQAIRLLRLFPDDAGSREIKRYEDLLDSVLRIRPLLSLSFPGTDLQSVEEIPAKDHVRYLLTATFLGLYGASSPLPTHYTEDLLDEASEDKTVTRDFLDILNHPFYRLFFLGWTRNRWFIKVDEEEDQTFSERLFCLLGLGSEEAKKSVSRPDRLLRYIGLFTQFPRSAMGLKTLISDAMDVPKVDVVPNVLRKVRIPENQRCLLGRQGAILGKDCYLGEEIDDRMGKIMIRIGPMGEEKYHNMLPHNSSYDELRELTAVYLNQPLDYELELELTPEEAKPIVLGGDKWSLLGYDTWSFSGPRLEGKAVAKFSL